MTNLEIKTKRLHLRPLQAADAEAVFRYRSDPEISRYQHWEPADLSEAERFIENNTKLAPGHWLQLAICLNDNHELIGDCGLHFPRDRDHETELGISLAGEYQGIGYAAEALKAVIGHLFNELGKHRVYASVDPRNLPSVKLLERVGMRKEGHFKKSVWFKGAWADDLVYAVLDEEWA